MLTLVTGARIVVVESPAEVIAAVLEWRAEIGRSTFIAPAGGGSAVVHG